jgi:hypothetical protein
MRTWRRSAGERELDARQGDPRQGAAGLPSQPLRDGLQVQLVFTPLLAGWSVWIGIAIGLAAALLAVDALGWRAVAAMFDRERLITGTRT